MSDAAHVPLASRVLAATATAAALTALPLLAWQAWVLWRHTPRLPEAGGPFSGAVPGQGRPLRTLVVGESTAAGVGAPTHRDSLAGRLAVSLAGATGRPVEWRVAGRNGATARSTLRDLCPVLGDEPVDLVVVALGVNDALDWVSPARWVRDLGALLDHLAGCPGGPRVVVAGVPPLDRFPRIPAPLGAVLGLRSRALDRAARRALAGRTGVVYSPFDIDGGAESFAPDGFHPSPVGYAAWAGHLAGAALSVRDIDGRAPVPRQAAGAG